MPGTGSLAVQLRSPAQAGTCTSGHWWCGVQRPRAHPHMGRGDVPGVTSHRHRLVRVHQGPQEGGGDRQPLLGPLEFKEPPRILTGVPETGAQGHSYDGPLVASGLSFSPRMTAGGPVSKASTRAPTPTCSALQGTGQGVVLGLPVFPSLFPLRGYPPPPAGPQALHPQRSRTAFRRAFSQPLPCHRAH